MRPSKKTITTLNRSITFTRTWWVKTASLFSLVAFLFSCEEDLNYLGFKSNQKRFQVYYAEIPITSSVVWMDSLSTQNLSSTQTNRMLLGQYSDPKVGTVRAEAFSQIRPADVSAIVPEFSVFDSVVLELRYDFYVYGSQGETTLAFNVHEVTEEMNNDNIFFANTQVAYDPTPLGNATSTINAEYFDQEASDTDADSLFTVRIKLDDDYGLRLLDAIDPEDENYTNFNFFKQNFKGLAIIPQQADKIVGLSNSNAKTVLTVYSHDFDAQRTHAFVLSQGVSFTTISTNRTGTELETLTQFFAEFEPAQNRYIQAGGSLVTKLDFSKYYEYIDTIPQLLLNSAELAIESFPAEEGFRAPSSLALAMLTDDNRLKTIKTEQDTLNYIAFGGLVVFGIISNADLPGSLFAADDQGALLTLPYTASDNSYKTYPTRFLQMLIELRETPFTSWALVSSSPAIGKSVTRTVFPKENLKLKIYYTRPTSNENQ